MITPQERARGLMFVKSIPENFGMIFVAERPEKASFWMKNTEIPLDLDIVVWNGETLRPQDYDREYFQIGLKEIE